MKVGGVVAIEERAAEEEILHLELSSQREEIGGVLVVDVLESIGISD